MPLESFVNGQRTRLPNTDVIYQMSGNPSFKTRAIPGAVMISTRQLPPDLLAPFLIAEKPFLADLTQYCDHMIFLPFLYHDQEWSEGFIGAGQEFARVLDTQCPGRNMLINLFDKNGARYEAENLHWTITPLLAAMKLNQLIEMIGAPEASLGLTQYYVSRYQGNLLTVLRERMLAMHPYYPESSLCQFYGQEAASRIALASEAQLSLSPQELNLLPALE